MKRIHLKLVALPLACLVITAAGCGGGGGGESTPASAAATAPGTGTSAPASPTTPTTPATQTAASSSAMLSGTTDPGPEIGKDGDFYLNTVTWMLFGPKANGTWPPGVQMGGGTGSGTGGGVVLTGAGAPANSVGNNGDYYLDTDTWTLYGPKANDVWPAGVSLVTQPGGSGGTGGTGGGTAGNGGHILYGSGAPTDDIGVDGDFYFDTTTSTLYGPKAGGKWPTSGVSMGTGTVYNGNFNVQIGRAHV